MYNPYWQRVVETSYHANISLPDRDTRVNANLFGMLLSVMSKPENRGKIIWIAATDYPNKVDEALNIESMRGLISSLRMHSG